MSSGDFETTQNVNLVVVINSDDRDVEVKVKLITIEPDN